MDGDNAVHKLADFLATLRDYQLASVNVNGLKHREGLTPSALVEESPVTSSLMLSTLTSTTDSRPTSRWTMLKSKFDIS